MINFKSKICLLCKKSFIPFGRRQLYCGSITKKFGCSYKRRLEWRIHHPQWESIKVLGYNEHRIELLNKYSHRCLICKTKINLQINHIIPQIIGGSNNINNLNILCGRCNFQEYNRIAIECMKFILENYPVKFNEIVYTKQKTPFISG